MRACSGRSSVAVHWRNDSRSCTQSGTLTGHDSEMNVTMIPSKPLPRLKLVFGLAIGPRALDQAERFAEDLRSEPAADFPRLGVTFGRVLENFEDQLFAAGIDDPILRDARFPVQITQHDRVFAFRAVAEDFQDHVRRAFELAVARFAALDRPHAAKAQRFERDEHEVWHTRQVGPLGSNVGAVDPQAPKWGFCHHEYA